MRFGYTIIYVADVEATLQFYSRAFDIPVGFLAEGGVYGELKTGETKLAFASFDMASANGLTITRASHDTVAPGVEIALVTAEVPAAYEKAVAAGALALHPPSDKPWGQTVAYVRDLNGVIVELCTPVD